MGSKSPVLPFEQGAFFDCWNQAGINEESTFSSLITQPVESAAGAVAGRVRG